MSKKLTPVVGYVRMSSGRQETSPAQQRAEINKLAKKHSYQIIRWYADEGISGDATEKRKEFQRMILDAEQKADFCAILCWDQDRFGRFDSIEAGRWIHPLREAGVWLVTVGQGIIDWNDFAGRMIYSVVQEGKHQFLVDLSKNILRGKIEAARHGRGSTVPPYGCDRAFFDPEGKLAKRVPYGEKFTKPRDWTMQFVVSKDTAAVENVRWIFRTFAKSDCGMSWLAKDLNQRGMPSPHGKAWSVQTIRKLLTNKIYIGANSFGENRHGKYHHMGNNGEITRGPGRNADGEAIIVEDAHEALIDRETFDRVGAKLADRATTGRKPRHSGYILSGVLRCGHCGGTLAGKAYHGRKAPRYYACVTGNTRPGACKRYQVQQSPIEDYVLGVIENRLLSDEMIDRITKSIYRQAKGETGFRDEIKALKAKVDAMDRKIAKGTENLLLADPDHFEALSSTLADWKKERSRLQSEIERKATNPDGRSSEETARRAVAELERLRKDLKSGDPMMVRAVVKAIVGEIRLWWEPYGKRNKRLAHGVLTPRDDFTFLSRTTKTGSATLSAVGILIGSLQGTGLLLRRSCFLRLRPWSISSFA